MGGVEECGRRGKVSVGGMEECGRAGGVWEGVRCGAGELGRAV